MKNENSLFVGETFFLDFESEDFLDFCASIPLKSTPKEQAIAIYEHVRDAFLYDPYHLDLRKNALKASSIVLKKRAWCVEKAIVTCSAFRKFEFPARLGFGIVKNHIGVEKLVSYLQREEIVFHGFVEVFVEGKWSKCTPAFDPRICKISGVEVLNWDTENDSLFQAYKGEEKFMEYLHFYGVFEDVPMELMHSEMKKYYPHLFSDPIDTKPFSFHFESEFL